MSGGFRRAELRGSDELFRPTRPDRDLEREADEQRPRGLGDRAAAAAAAPTGVPGEAGVDLTPPPHRQEGRLLRLTDEEIEILADAVQHLKYPTTKPVTKPPMDVFERLEELRRKLLG